MNQEDNFQIVGYKNAKHYVDANLDVDQAFYDNEDLGLNAAIAADAVVVLPLPYPADIN